MTDKQTFQSGFVALIGRPNVGKSTLLNRLIGHKVAIMSDKPQTTRNRIQAILTTKEEQIVFLDTPGIHQARTRLGDYMNRAAVSSLTEVDLVLWLIEPNDYIGKGDRHILGLLAELKKPVVLVINKVDTLPRQELLKVIEAYKDHHAFREIIPISALTGENTEDLLPILRSYLSEGPQFFPAEMITDQPEKQWLAEIIREKALGLLKEEVPHGLAVVIEQIDDYDKGMEIQATIICERKSHKPIILGKQGAMIKRIGIQARKEIEKYFGVHIRLELWVKVKSQWRDSDFLLKNYGYNHKEL